MHRLLPLVSAVVAATFLTPILAAAPPAGAKAPESQRLLVADYVDKMKAGWIGQMAGVGQGAPTEFKFLEQIIPAEKVPVWKPSMINQFNQDDIYVEMTFLRTLEQYGMDVSIRQAGIDFANSGYRLWHANKFGRENLRKGIAPPDSGHPKFNQHADDIDYQIEADFSGLIAPGLPNVAIQMGDIFGRLMNYGDGLYGGQFVGGMYAAAFFESDPGKIVEAGLRCIPAESQYAECIRDVVRWHGEDPDHFETCWQKVEAKYQKNSAYRRFSCNKGKFNIDAKINGAYIVIGLLYGGGDLDKTIVISTRCGQDSDCNPSNAAGILATTIGFRKLPERYKSALDPEGKFSHTPYTFPALVRVCEKLARRAVERSGGRVEHAATGKEVFIIPVQEPKPGKCVRCWDPEPIAGSRFTPAEMERVGNPPANRTSGAPMVGSVPVVDVLRRMGAKQEAGADAKELDAYSSHFDRGDLNGDGKHSKEEYIDKGGYMTPQARAGIFRAADGNGDGVVTKAEYVLNRIITDEAKAIVQGMDDDKNRLVEQAEFIAHATKLMSDEGLAGQLFDSLDTNDDGGITIPEYLRIWGQWARAGRKPAEERVAARRAELSNPSGQRRSRN